MVKMEAQLSATGIHLPSMQVLIEMLYSIPLKREWSLLQQLYHYSVAQLSAH